MEVPKCKEVEEISQQVNNFVERIRHQCKMCDRIHLSSEKLDKHYKMFHRIYTCKTCGEKSNMWKHCSEFEFCCKKCKRKFSSKEKLNAHDREKCVQINCDEIQFHCSKCTIKFSSKKELKAHKTTHNVCVQCDECLETFASKKLLNIHSKVHSQRFFIECDFCETICDNEDSLKEHMNSHNINKTEKETKIEKKPLKSIPRYFSCKLCRGRFVNESRLKEHSEVCYLSLFPCDKCLKNYKSQNALASHLCPMKDVVYKCNVCNEAFDKKDDLFKHFFIHKSTQGVDLYM